MSHGRAAALVGDLTEAAIRPSGERYGTLCPSGSACGWRDRRAHPTYNGIARAAGRRRLNAQPVKYAKTSACRLDAISCDRLRPDARFGSGSGPTPPQKAQLVRSHGRVKNSPADAEQSRDPLRIVRTYQLRRHLIPEAPGQELSTRFISFNMVTMTWARNGLSAPLAPHGAQPWGHRPVQDRPHPRRQLTGVGAPWTGLPTATGGQRLPLQPSDERAAPHSEGSLRGEELDH